VALSELDRNLLRRCLARKSGSWEDFVDRFMGLVVHVINHSAQARSIRLQPQDREDLCAEVFLTLIEDDFATLRHFRGQSSLATYLTVVARRVVVRTMIRRKMTSRLAEAPLAVDGEAVAVAPEQPVIDREEVERLIEGLNADEARVVRLFHLESKTYQEISQLTGIPENTIGPMLSRAREKMRRADADSAAAT
jgi:RNA polymerase sigma-70 factor (ECF subfamily)